MFADSKEFIKGIQNQNYKRVCCNECEHKQDCIDKQLIGYVVYPDGNKGYAKTTTHYFNNTCNFPID